MKPLYEIVQDKDLEALELYANQRGTHQKLITNARELGGPPKKLWRTTPKVDL